MKKWFFRVFGGRFVSCRVSTTETTEGNGKNGTEQLNPPENATDYTPFSPLAIRCVPLRLHLSMAKKPKSVAPRLKECWRNRSDCRCRLALPRNRHRLLPQTFRSYSFARSVADLGFSPDGNRSRFEVQEGEWARNRIIGHGFRSGARTNRPIPYFPRFSVSSVVKTLPLTSALSVVKNGRHATMSHFSTSQPLNLSTSQLLNISTS